jgi:putative addiction module component (TIGR02574 family)
MDVAEALQAVGTLPAEEQLDFIFRAWDQLVDSGWQPEPSPELRAELDRRLDAHSKDPSKVLTWEEIEAHLRRTQ